VTRGFVIAGAVALVLGQMQPSAQTVLFGTQAGTDFFGASLPKTKSW
jgi:hypothetical protein